jgi:hypothetical protein
MKTMNIAKWIKPTPATPCIVGALLAGICLVASAGRSVAADAPDQMAPVLSPFGIGGDASTGRDLTRWIPQMAAIGIHVMRTCSPSQMDFLAEHQITFGGLLYGVPKEDKLDAPGSLPVKNLPAWVAHVTNEVRIANGRVKYWELWNEPPNGIGRNQTAADYAKLLVATYNAAHGVDPTCLVGMAAKSVHVNWLEQTILAGGKDHFDYIVLHPYETLGIAVDHAGAEPVYLSIVPTVRKMLAAQDPAKLNVPIIFTELGCDAGRSVIHQAHALVKAYTMGIAQGVTCIQWFEGMDGDSGPMGLMDARRRPRPAYTAMAQMIQHFGQHPTYLGWVMFNDKDYGFVFQGARGTVLVTWAPKGTTDHVRFGGSVQIVDPLTGRTTSASEYDLATGPILVLGVPADLVARAQANKAKPLPWDGDYTDAKSVSVTMGPRNVEKGLHTQSAQSVAADVIAYGGSARAGSVPGGNVFMVDPNFLSYTPTPIEVSIVVRRNANNDNAGFKFVYESTNGYRNCGWYTVPDNKEWHTVKYKITDAQFVSMWGYSFALDSDGNQLNKYDIQSVTVTKLDK